MYGPFYSSWWAAAATGQTAAQHVLAYGSFDPPGLVERGSRKGWANMGTSRDREDVIKLAAGAANPTAWELHGSAPASKVSGRLR